MLRALLFIALLSIGPSSARADDLRPGYLEIRELCGAPMPATRRGLTPNGDCSPSPENSTHLYAIVWKAPIKPGLARGVTPGFPADCAASTPPERSIDAAALLAKWQIICAQPLAGRVVRLNGIESSAGDALLRYQSRAGETQAARLTPAHPATTIAARPARTQVARTYFLTGVEHILTGYDHLLFVLGLVLLLSGAWRVAATVTAFTIAHSLTLVATTLNLVALPRAPVEAAIALSIVFLATEIVKREPGEPRLSERVPWIVAFLFGLLHGFGFAGALAEIGLPSGEVPTALLTFNLGVEAGQLIIVATAVAALALLQWTKADWLGPARTASAYAIGSVAAMWLLQRVLGG